jgi:UDP-N-acetylmuramate dehydrogenase
VTPAPPGATIERDVPIGPRTTYRVGGSAAWFVEAGSEDDLRAAAALVREHDLDVAVVGNGSNLLVADGGFDGLAVVLGDGFASIDIAGTTVIAGGAALLPVVARQTAAAGLTGFEWAVGVPGSVGGAVRMNAGGHGSDMAATLVSARLFDLRRGTSRDVDLAGLELGYRSSSVTADETVVWARLALEVGDRAASETEIGEIVRWRRANQPGGQNAGSVFTNPTDDTAGRLIEAAGAKGLRIGTAQVSPKHANFIIADAGGRAGDVYALMVEVRRRVADETGIVLHPETRLLGFDPLPEVGR